MCETLLTLKQVCERVSMSPSYVRLLIRNDKFPPASHKISPRTVRWLESTITEWIQLNAKNNN